ncbi:uncharacterized protein EKO05_0007175 [Ascochyta rabiei]|uniref:uncharacterized protein n=1 Tax=Didymella rabiei TaxID=5454 RepID=UPI002200F7AF|nr:uncharacterized protein EKO05_0007175 [Ascochyta rabiei]UPX16789.1 hypothetical protein EKO05_0007175 [Ascochyta rabiei]
MFRPADEHSMRVKVKVIRVTTRLPHFWLVCAGAQVHLHPRLPSQPPSSHTSHSRPGLIVCWQHPRLAFAMAVLPSQPAIEVSVVCNGAALQEYEDDEDAPNGTVMTKYVEAVSGAEFHVRWTITKPWPQYTILFELWLDQKYTDSEFAQQKHFNDPSYSSTIEGATSMINGQSFLHKFCFAALTVDENKAGQLEKNIMQDIQKMGEITVKAYFVKNLSPSATVDQALPNKIEQVGKIPEKALKGRTLSHQISLRAPQVRAPYSTCRCDYVGRKRKPFGTYTFKYRSRDALKSLLLIPRSPTPVPLEDKDVDALSPEELRELVRRQRVRDAASRTVKQEAGVKRERPNERSSALPDNTDDDELLVVSTKRRRETYPTNTNKDGMEEIDLT